MAFPRVSDFKNTLRDGGARPSLFQMVLKFPGLARFAADAERVFRFHCRVAEIPPSTLNPLVVKYAGREVKYAAQRTYPNLSVTVLNDERFTVRRSLEDWIDTINTADGNVSLYPRGETSSLAGSGYGGIGTVRQYSQVGESARGYTFIDLFPVNVGPIALDWNNDAAIEEYTVEFAYQYWSPESSSQEAGQLSNFFEAAAAAARAVEAVTG